MEDEVQRLLEEVLNKPGVWILTNEHTKKISSILIILGIDHGRTGGILNGEDFWIKVRTPPEIVTEQS